MKVTIIPEKCIACGLCQTYSSQFDYDDEGIVRFSQSNQLSLDLPDSEDTILAVKSCPTKALICD